MLTHGISLVNLEMEKQPIRPSGPMIDDVPPSCRFREKDVKLVPEFQLLDTGPVGGIIAKLAQTQLLTPARMRRWATDALLSHCNANKIKPPHALNVKEMAAATFDVMVPGPSPLISPQISHNECSRLHIGSCELCKMKSKVCKECYFSRIEGVLKNGWSPPFDPKEVKGVYTVVNGSKTASFPGAVSKAVDKLLRLGKIQVTDKVNCVSGVNLVLKNVDILWAKTRGIKMSSDDDVVLVNNARASEGLAPIKVRMVHDYSGSGLNGAQLKIRYSNIGLNDVIDVLHPNCFVSIGDLKAYYESYSVSEKMSTWFAFQVFGVLYRATCIMFGFAPAPAFCATMTAEILSWIRMVGIVAVAMTDDFLLVSRSASESRHDMQTVVDMLKPCGFVFAEEKFQLATQKFLFIGFVVDTVEMSVSFHPSGVKAYLGVLKEAVKTFKSFKCLPTSEIESLAGKLNSYASLIQQGRVHVHLLWKIAHNPLLLRVKRIRERLVVDLEFWVKTLSTLAVAGHLPVQFPILSAQKIAEDPSSIVIVRSDASGLVGVHPEQDGGWGYVAGYMLDTNPKFKYGRWYGKYSFGPHSHHGELTVLLIFLENSYDKIQICKTDSKVSLLFWITDCSAAALSINKGHCRSEESIGILADILRLCDEKNIWIVALWWPREQGMLEDFLTHLSSHINRDCGEGTIEDLQDITFNAGEGSSSNRKQASRDNGQEAGSSLREFRNASPSRKGAFPGETGHAAEFFVPASQTE